MIALIVWDRILPPDDGGKIRALSIAKMAALHEPTRVISFSHLNDPRLIELTTKRGNLEIVQLNLANPVFDQAYRLSTFIWGFPTFVPNSIRTKILELSKGCDVVILNGLKPLTIFRQTRKAVILSLFEIDWLTYRFILRSKNRFLLAHWHLTGRWYFNRSLRSVQKVLVPSARDREILLRSVRHFAAEKVEVLPTCIDIDEFQSANGAAPPRSETGRKMVVFAGTMNYFPNTDALETIVTWIAPALPEVDFVLVGKEPPVERPLPDNVSFTGFVQDTKEHISRASVAICPLRFGEGTRVKILEFMALGKPVVSTTKGAEGLDVSPGKDILLADDWTEFCARIRDLLSNEERARELGEAGRRLVTEKYHYEVYRERMAAILKEAASNRYGSGFQARKSASG
jgi:glycosyltransferase involved in cell wall biosynthesis